MQGSILEGGPCMHRIFSALLITFGLLPAALSAQELNYREIFAEDWVKAEQYVTANRHWMEPVLKDNNIPYRLAIAVIFPELVRYSALRDRMETTLLKALYVNLGEEYANFSIGRFQIKPSFAEIICLEAPKALGKRSDIRFPRREEFENISNYRKSLVVDLEDPKTQFNYVIAFMKICEKKFRTDGMSTGEKLKFLSTAYNYGIDRSIEEISDMIESKFFTTKVFKSETYCYSDIALFWYNQDQILAVNRLHGKPFME